MSFFLILSFKTADAGLFKINPELQQAIGMSIYFCRFRGRCFSWVSARENVYSHGEYPYNDEIAEYRHRLVRLVWSEDTKKLPLNVYFLNK